MVLQTHRRTSVRPLIYYYHTSLDRTKNISRKVCAPRHVSSSGAPNNVQNFHLDKTSQHLKKPTQHLVVRVETDLNHVVDGPLAPLVVPPRLVEHLEGTVRVTGVPLEQPL